MRVALTHWRQERPVVLGSLVLLGAVLIVAAVWLVASRGGADDNAGERAEPAPPVTPLAPSVVPTSPKDDEVSPVPDDNTPSPRDAPGSGPAATPANQPVSCPEATVEVNDADGLTKALAAARPGDVIHLADGTYEGRFSVTAKAGTGQPIWLCGGTAAVLDGGGTKAGYVLHLDGAENWRIVGFTIQNGQKGVMADGAVSNVVQDLTVQDIGDEGIHLRAFSSGNAVIGNVVRRTGSRKPKFGEGIYVGSAKSNWSDISAGQPDRSDNNLVAGNTISATTSENVDIKEGTTGGVLTGNSFDGAGTSDADSWVDVKGNGWLVAGNTGSNAPLDGFQTHEILDGWGTGNTFRGNTADVVAPGLGFHLAPPLANLVTCDNKTSTGAPATASVACSG